MAMALFPWFLTILTAFSMAGGQVLFKLGAAEWQADTLGGWIVAFLRNPYLVVAVLLYATTVLMWIYLLRTLPLSLVYPVTALSYVLVPLFSYLFLHERISWQVAIGSLVIVTGVIITHMKGA